MSDRGSLLVLNAGSSSVKFRTFDLGPDGPAPDLGGQVALDGDVVRLVVRRGAETLADRSLGSARLDHGVALDAVAEFLDGRHALDRCIGVGHRVVHGGAEYAAPTRIDDAVLARLDAYVPLLFWGAGIKPGQRDESASPGCLGTTLARLLGIDPPAAASVQTLESVLDVN